MTRNIWNERKLVLIPLFILAFVVPLGFIVMALWNNILVPVLHISAIDFWQALGIFLLSKILFGGFPGPRGGGFSGRWKNKMREKWDAMTPEEKERVMQRWESRRNPGKDKPDASETIAAE